MVLFFGLRLRNNTTTNPYFGKTLTLIYEGYQPTDKDLGER